MPKRDIASRLRQLTAEQYAVLDPQEIFTSPEFAEHLQCLVNETMKIGGKATSKISVHVVSESSDPPGWTDGNGIYVNTINSISSHYTLPLEQFIALRGICFHECSHVLYLDFNEEKRALKSIDEGKLYGELPDPQTAEDDLMMHEMEDALADPLYRPIFQQVFSDVTNTIDDPHDEGKIIRRFGGIVEQGIVLARESLLRSYDYAENIVAEDQTDLEKIYSLMLEYARFETIMMRDQETCLKTQPLVQCVVSLAKPIATARWTDDMRVRFAQINEIMLKLWPYIKAEVANQKQKRNQPGNGNSKNSRNDQSGSNPAQEAIQNVLDQLQKVSQSHSTSAHPEHRSSSAEAVKNRRAARAGKQPATEGKNSTVNKDAEMKSAQAALDAISKKIAARLAAASMERDLTSSLMIEIDQATVGSNHGRRVVAKRDLEVDASDIKLYEKQMEDVKAYSRRLRRRMADALHDLQEGGIAHHKQFGNRIEAQYAYRPDQKFFANKRLPQDWPTMAISILVDLSTSMRGERLDSAMKATMLLYDFATGLGIPVFVAGHNAVLGMVNYQIMADFEKVSENDKYRLAHMYLCGCNRDGATIEVSSALLAKRSEDVKLLFIISDGQPNDNGYKGEVAKKDIQDILTKYRRKGITTFATAIGSDKDKIKAIYGDGYLDITDLTQFPKQLTNMVVKRIMRY